MARRRMISPLLWEDEHFGKLSDKAKILFISCISNADDDGRLSGNPSNLRATAFRFDDITIKRIEDLVIELSENLSHFKYYGVNGCKYIQLEKWEEYQSQRDDRRLPSRHPNVTQMSTKCQPKLREVKLSKDKVSKVKYKEYIYLYNNELTTLTDRFGKFVVDKYIDKLNNYIGSKGKQYKSHYHTLLTWINKDGVNPKQKKEVITKEEECMSQKQRKKMHHDTKKLLKTIGRKIK